MLVGAPDPLTEACGADTTRTWLCELTFEITGTEGAARVGRHLSPWITALLIVVGAWCLNRIVRRVIKRIARRMASPNGGGRLQALRRKTGLETSTGTPALRREQRAQSIGDGLRSFASILITLAAVFAILGTFGIELRSIFATAGLLGVVLGFGAQNLLRDLISGTFMLVEDQFGIGDVIDVGGAIGTVEHMTLRMTRLRDDEGVVWHIPNGEVKRVGNKSHQWSRAILDIPIAYDSDLEVATEAISHAADTMWREEQWATRMLSQPEVLGVESIAASGVVIRLAVKTLPAEQWIIARELRVRVKAKLDEAGIERPPHFFVTGPE